MKKIRELELPDAQLLAQEVAKTRRRSSVKKTFRNALFTLITISAVAVLIATLWLPVFQVTGSSMTPTLVEGEIVIAEKGGSFETGDMIAFYYNNKILVKRLIAQAGDWVNINEDGVVSVNEIILDEPYVSELAFGDCDIELPYQVPESRVFVMGDHRSVSLDSRSTTVGCVSDEQIVGKLLFRVWPFDRIGGLEIRGG